MENQTLTERLSQLETKLQGLAELATLKQTLREQQSEIANLREALAHKNFSATLTNISNVPTPLSAKVNQLPGPDMTRRRMLKRMGLAVLAGGAALGVTAATYAPAEAKLIVTATAKFGALVFRNGASITLTPNTSNYGLVASADDSFNANTILSDGYNIGVVGLSSQAVGNSIGVFGYSQNGDGISGGSSNGNGVYGKAVGGDGVSGYSISGSGVSGGSGSGTGVNGLSTTYYGVIGISSSGTGTYGSSTTGIGVYGETQAATSSAITARNSDTSAVNGIALILDRGGLTVTGAGMSTQTCAFIHQTTSSNINSNIYSIIDNPFCNGRPDALLFVTQNANPPSTTSSVEPHPFGVVYGSGIAKWKIYHADGATIPVGLFFNILVINP